MKSPASTGDGRCVLDDLIELAIRHTTGPGDETPSLYRVCSWLSAQCGAWSSEDFQEVFWYLAARQSIPMKDFRHSPNNRGRREIYRHG
jgi:hypothetical protein